MDSSELNKNYDQQSQMKRKLESYEDQINENKRQRQRLEEEEQEIYAKLANLEKSAEEFYEYGWKGSAGKSVYYDNLEGIKNFRGLYSSKASEKYEELEKSNKRIIEDIDETQDQLNGLKRKEYE